jgi:hypothetical protein
VTAPPSSDARRSVADRFRAIFPSETITLVDGIDEIGRRFDQLTDQRPSTCGAYALSYLLPAMGFERHDGNDVAAEDYLAHLAGVVVEAREIPPSDEVGERVARGELSEGEAMDRFGSIWYRWPVRWSSDPVAQGTSPAGIARAVELASDGRLAIVPVAGRRSDGEVLLDEARWGAFFDLLLRNLDGWRMHAILNYESDKLLRPRPPSYSPETIREPGAVERLPRDDWGVGHFAGLAGLWRRANGERWLLLLDTYKDRGFEGYQPQPAELVRRGLVRTDGRGGGMLIIVERELAAKVTAAIEALGIRPAMWSNGSPDPDDYRWEPVDPG